MNRWLKWMLVLAGGLVMLMIVAAIVLPRLFDNEELKRKIITTVSEETGRELRIDGDLDFSVFPVLALEVNQLVLGNARGFGDAPFAEIERARAAVAVLPLLRQDIQTEEVILDGLRLNLAVNKNGVSNWADLAADEKSAPPPEINQHIRYRAPRIAGVRIADANIDYRDQQAGLHYRLSGFTLKTGALGTDSAVPVTLAMALEDVGAGSRMEMAFSADAEFDSASQSLSLPNLQMRLDESQVTGTLGLQLMNAALPALRFDLDMDQLDLDRYLPAGDPADADEPGTDAAIPQGELAGLDVNGTLRIASLSAMGMDFTDAVLGVSLKDSNLQLKPLDARFYGGEYRGEVTLNAAGAKPRLSLSTNLTSVTFAQLADDLFDYDQVSGSAYASLQAAGSGRTNSELMNDLAGNLELRLDEGALEGVDIWYEIRKAMALLKGRPVPGGDEGRTVFSRMNVDGTLGGGALQLQEIQAELPFLKIAGNGQVDLNSTALDIRLLASVLSSPGLADDPLASDLEGRSVPFLISGSADNPKFTVDIQNLMKGEATRQLLDRLGLGEEDEAGADTGEQSAEKAVKGLLGGLLSGKKKKEDKDDDDGGN
jgi:AsmA protein